MSTGKTPWDFAENASERLHVAAERGQDQPDPAVPAPPPADSDPFAPEHSPYATSLAAVRAAGPPLPLLWLASATAALSLLGAGVFGGAAPVAVASWLLAGPVAIGVLAGFTVRDTAARARPLYLSPHWLRHAHAAVLTLSLIGVMLAAWRIASWVGRL